jgi:hypothetical protein
MEIGMLQLSAEAIREVPQNETVEITAFGNMAQTYTSGTAIVGSVAFDYSSWQPYTYWGPYPVYVCTDKTKKAIEVLKALQAEKLLKCDSVPRFIQLVDKIAGLL